MGVHNIKVTMFFTFGTVGWDESHYYIPTPALTSGALQTDVAALVKARVGCLDGVNGRLVDARMSYDDINRDVVHLDRGSIPIPGPKVGYFPQGGPNMNTPAWTYQTPQVAWPILFDTLDPVVDSTVYISGMPLSITQTGPSPYDDSTGSPVALYLQAYAKYLNSASLWGALSGRQWPAETITAANSNPLLNPPVWAAAVGGGVPTITVTATNPFVPAPYVGGYVRLGGLKWQNHYSRQRFNHTYQVLAINGLVLTLAAPKQLYSPVFLTNGYLQVGAQRVVNYQQFSLRNMTHKKRGRPTYSPRGRRAA